MKYKEIIMTIVLVFTTSISYAESEKFYIGEAIGKYLKSVDIMYQLERTECSFLINEDYNVHTAFYDLQKYLSGDEINDVRDLINSEHFQKSSRDTYSDILNTLQEATKQGLDPHDVCVELKQQADYIYNTAVLNLKYKLNNR